MERGEEFVVQVADFLLSDGGEGIDRVKPNVEGWVFSQLGKAGVLEVLGVLDRAQSPHKVGSLGQHGLVVCAEAVDGGSEVFAVSLTSLLVESVGDGAEES